MAARDESDRDEELHINDADAPLRLSDVLRERDGRVHIGMDVLGMMFADA